MSKEFELWLKSENIPLAMFKMLPKPMREDIEKRYFELKKQNEKGEKANEN